MNTIKETPAILTLNADECLAAIKASVAARREYWTDLRGNSWNWFFGALALTYYLFGYLSTSSLAMSILFMAYVGAAILAFRSSWPAVTGISVENARLRNLNRRLYEIEVHSQRDRC